MNANVIFSHKSDLWTTPKDIYDFFSGLGYFDPCPVNPLFDGLSVEWGKKNFINPPYSQIGDWVNRAVRDYNYRKFDKTWFLVPARTDTRWFNFIYSFCDYVIFITGCLKFGDSSNSAPFPSVLLRLGDLRDFRFVTVVDREFLLAYLAQYELA